MKLYELAKLVRTKNAGPFMLTIDILFDTDDRYRKVKDSQKLSIHLISELYGVPAQQVEYYECPGARALKFSFPRPAHVGEMGDNDIFGGQYHAPLVNIDIDAIDDHAVKGITMEQFSEWLPEIEFIKNPEWKKTVYDIWKEAFENSNWDVLTKAKFNRLSPDVTLLHHTSAVTQCAVVLADTFKNVFDIETDRDKLIVMCLLHDVCKLLELDPDGEGSQKNKIGKTYQHGFLSAYYAQRAGLPEDIVASLIAHTGQSRSIPSTIEGIILYYADMANVDILRLLIGAPLYLEQNKT